MFFLLEGNEIDHEALLYLDFETMKELVPKIGPRTKLWQKLKTYQALHRMPVIIEERVEDQPSGSNLGSNVVSFIFTMISCRYLNIDTYSLSELLIYC